MIKDDFINIPRPEDIIAAVEKYDREETEVILEELRVEIINDILTKLAEIYRDLGNEELSYCQVSYMPGHMRPVSTRTNPNSTIGWKEVIDPEDFAKLILSIQKMFINRGYKARVGSPFEYRGTSHFPISVGMLNAPRPLTLADLKKMDEDLMKARPQPVERSVDPSAQRDIEELMNQLNNPLSPIRRSLRREEVQDIEIDSAEEPPF